MNTIATLLLVLTTASAPQTPTSAPATACAAPPKAEACGLHDPAGLLAAEPTAAGARTSMPMPLTRRQVIAEIERARRAGEMDFARKELGQ